MRKMDEKQLLQIIEEAAKYNLTFLYLGSNKLTSLPPEIGKLKNLKKLYLRNNDLSSLPPEIGKLNSLQELYLHDNHLTILPPEIGKLKNLKKLYLSNNDLSSLPPEIGKLNSLQELYLHDNHLIILPPEIGKLSYLSMLDLSKNNLTNLPSKIIRLKNLKRLYLSSNPLEAPPLEIVIQGIDAIFQYFEQVVREGIDYLHEAKLLIVGEPGAGKTTLAKKIQDKDYKLEPSEASTEGIEIIEWDFDLYEAGKDQFNVNIWDFGGQEIYHATHQFFLTRRSLYIVLADNRKEDTDFNYWLEVVDTLSGGSPLLIVLNERGDRAKQDIAESQLRARFTNLKDIIFCNLADNRGLREIVSQMKHHLQHLPHIGDPLPASWVKVRAVLDENPADHITIQEYLRLCQENGFESEADALQLSQYLHDLGVCLHFQDDPRLVKMVILNPTWATNAVYKVLDNQQVIDQRGQFSQADLNHIWGTDRYKWMEAELLQLMIRFQLCYPLKDTPNTHIAPQLLPSDPPDYPWTNSDNRHLRYHYPEFMPKGVITRFIAAMHPHILDQTYVWKTGVILEKDNTRAKVIEMRHLRQLHIRVEGDFKREILTLLIHTLDDLHRPFQVLKYEKLIPCNCEDCRAADVPHFFDYESLRRRQARGKRTIECDHSFEDVSVQRLLDDIGEQVGGASHSDLEGLRRIIEAKQRRLQLLKENEGKKGINTSPETVMEIEDLEAEISELQSDLDSLN